MFGVLQIAYYSVGSIDNVNLMMIGLMDLKVLMAYLFLLLNRLIKIYHKG